MEDLPPGLNLTASFASAYGKADFSLIPCNVVTNFLRGLNPTNKTNTIGSVHFIMHNMFSNATFEGMEGEERMVVGRYWYEFYRWMVEEERFMFKFMNSRVECATEFCPVLEMDRVGEGLGPGVFLSLLILISLSTIYYLLFILLDSKPALPTRNLPTYLLTTFISTYETFHDIFQILSFSLSLFFLHTLTTPTSQTQSDIIAPAFLSPFLLLLHVIHIPLFTSSHPSGSSSPRTGRKFPRLLTSYILLTLLIATGTLSYQLLTSNPNFRTNKQKHPIFNLFCSSAIVTQDIRPFASTIKRIFYVVYTFFAIFTIAVIISFLPRRNDENKIAGASSNEVSNSTSPMNYKNEEHYRFWRTGAKVLAGFAMVGAWVCIGMFIRFRSVRVIPGRTDVGWTFAQIAALAVWVLLVRDIFTLWIYGPKTGLEIKLPPWYLVKLVGEDGQEIEIEQEFEMPVLFSKRSVRAGSSSVIGGRRSSSWNAANATVAYRNIREPDREGTGV